MKDVILMWFLFTRLILREGLQGFLRFATLLSNNVKMHIATHEKQTDRNIIWVRVVYIRVLPSLLNERHYYHRTKEH